MAGSYGVNWDRMDMDKLRKEYVRRMEDFRPPNVPRWKSGGDALKETHGFDFQGHRNMLRSLKKLAKEQKTPDMKKEALRRREEAMENVTRTVVNYSPMVKLGNWTDQRDIQEEDLNRFLRLRARGELMVQRTRQIVGECLRPISMAPKKFIEFGDRLQLIAPRAKAFKERGKADGLVLSCVLNGSESGSVSAPTIEGTPLSGSTLLAPCARNVLELCPVNETDVPAKENSDVGDEGAPKGRLKYGMEFRLKYVGGPQGLPYYVTVNPSRLCLSDNRSRHGQTHLYSRKSWANVWRAYAADRNKRQGTIGKEIAGNEEVIIVSAILNRCLCCETEYWYSTLFGLECEATAFTYYNVYGKETDNNIWYFN